MVYQARNIYKDATSLMLTTSLLVMLALEPIRRCFGGYNVLRTESCAEGQATFH